MLVFIEKEWGITGIDDEISTRLETFINNLRGEKTILPEEFNDKWDVNKDGPPIIFNKKI